MEPVVVVVDKEKDGTIRLSPEQFGKIIQRAYKDGYEAGKAAAAPQSPQYPQYPQSPQFPQSPFIPCPNQPWISWTYPYCGDSTTITNPTLSDNNINSPQYTKPGNNE